MSLSFYYSFRRTSNAQIHIEWMWQLVCAWAIELEISMANEIHLLSNFVLLPAIL